MGGLTSNVMITDACVVNMAKRYAKSLDGSKIFVRSDKLSFLSVPAAVNVQHDHVLKCLTTFAAGLEAWDAKPKRPAFPSVRSIRARLV